MVVGIHKYLFIYLYLLIVFNYISYIFVLVFIYCVQLIVSNVFIYLGISPVIILNPQIIWEKWMIIWEKWMILTEWWKLQKEAKD